MKNRLSEVVDRLEREHGRVVITKHGRPAVMLSLEDLESLEETSPSSATPSWCRPSARRMPRSPGSTTRLSKQEALAEIER